jgi:hypothetical protein
MASAHRTKTAPIVLQPSAPHTASVIWLHGALGRVASATCAALTL